MMLSTAKIAVYGMLFDRPHHRKKRVERASPESKCQIMIRYRLNMLLHVTIDISRAKHHIAVEAYPIFSFILTTACISRLQNGEQQRSIIAQMKGEESKLHAEQVLHVDREIKVFDPKW